MKFLETHFDDYIKKVESINLHPELDKLQKKLPDKLCDFKNILLYGPPGVGKYSQMLNLIKKYSPSGLKYEKKIICNYDKKNFPIKISDIHFEVDLSLLGCNSKQLWYEMYVNIKDAISATNNKQGIIVCKNFHNINSELLDNFYSYLQTNFLNIKIVFIIITEQISFIPENILNTFKIISIGRPSKTNYKKITKKVMNNIDLKEIVNIKNILTENSGSKINLDNYSNILFDFIKNPETIDFLQFRDIIYDLFIFDFEIGKIIWNILLKLKNEEKINNNQINQTFKETYKFFQLYNNNYRPIYHLENYLYNIIKIIHEI